METTLSFFTEADGIFFPINPFFRILADQNSEISDSTVVSHRQMIAVYKIGYPYVYEAQSIGSAHQDVKKILITADFLNNFFVLSYDTLQKVTQLASYKIQTMNLFVKDANGIEKLEMMFNENAATIFE
jgi:hypothetical protein